MECQTQWSRSSTFLVFNSILIAAIALSYQNSVKLPYYIITFLPIAGLIACVLWYSMNSRSFRWIKHWIVSANKIEKEYLKDIKLELNPVLKGNVIKRENESWLNSQKATNILIIIIAIIYLMFLYHSLIINVSKKIILFSQYGKIHQQQNFYDPCVSGRDFSF